jgi:hypothetical protein
VGRPGLEPGTCGLKVRRAASCASGPGDGANRGASMRRVVSWQLMVGAETVRLLREARDHPLRCTNSLDVGGAHELAERVASADRHPSDRDTICIGKESRLVAATHKRAHRGLVLGRISGPVAPPHAPARRAWHRRSTSRSRTLEQIDQIPPPVRCYGTHANCLCHGLGRQPSCSLGTSKYSW